MWDGCGSQTASAYLNRAHNSSGRIYYPLLIFLVSWEKDRGCFWCDWLRHDDRKPVTNNIWWPASRRPTWTHIHKESQRGQLICVLWASKTNVGGCYVVVNILGGCYVVLCCCKYFGWLLSCCYVDPNAFCVVARVLLCGSKCMTGCQVFSSSTAGQCMHWTLAQIIVTTNNCYTWLSKHY